jgi:16S rRNA (guanine527-N7)-methyltransferase
LQKKQFAQLGILYPEWNEKINVISRADIEHLYERHILHSLAIAKIIKFKPSTQILDVGTGGGFPGIPLAILFPDVKFHLIDSIGKKIKVVQDIIIALDLKNAKATHLRAEDDTEEYDFILSRAVTHIKIFYDWVHKKCSKESSNDLQNGILYLKGGDITEEFAELKAPFTVFQLSAHFDTPFFETKKLVHVPL